MSTQPGTLWVVSTPIGNMGDLSPRASEVLQSADRIIAEDTRHTGRMLATLGIRRPLVSLHEQNESMRAPDLIRYLREGQNLALVSDAGTPLISDPGYRFLRLARESAANIRAVPGPSAVLAALAVSGLPTDRFFFEGFLPSRPAARRARIAELLAYPWTVIVFESSHRILDCAQDLAAIDAIREICLGRELTKHFEEYFFGMAGALPEWIKEDPLREKGEFVLVLAGSSSSSAGEKEITREQEQILEILAAEFKGKERVRLGSLLTGLPRNLVYNWMIKKDIQQD